VAVCPQRRLCSSPGQVIWDLWWSKRHWGTSAFPATHSTDCFTLIRGSQHWPAVAHVPSGLGLTSPRFLCLSCVLHVRPSVRSCRVQSLEGSLCLPGCRATADGEQLKFVSVGPVERGRRFAWSPENTGVTRRLDGSVANCVHFSPVAHRRPSPPFVRTYDRK
jgi:hypothetical protein